MFQYEYEKRPQSASSCASRSTTLTSWDPPTPITTRPPLPPRPAICQRMPSKTTVPLKVWIIASASCFAVCAALVLATVVITKWGSTQEYTRQIYEEPESVYSKPHPIYITQKPQNTDEDPTTNTNEIDADMEIIEKLSIFKNVVAQRASTKKDLISKPQIHPIHDTIEHAERKIEKKDKPKYPDQQDLETVDYTTKPIPSFKPTLPDVFIQGQVKLPDGYLLGFKKPNPDYEEYYRDDNLYDDYMQSNSMTNYLIEKVQELHDWINSDPDFDSVKNASKIARNSNEFTEVLKALNQSLVQGNVSIVMSKLKDLYLGDSNKTLSHGRKMIVSNSTDLLSFGILTLDILLLHNIQQMAWENQESARTKMLKDPDVFAFNALFMEPSKVEARQNEINGHDLLTFSKRQGFHQDSEEFDIGTSILDNFLEIGVSTTRAAIHLGRAYKNTKAILAQLSNHETAPENVHNQLSRRIDENTHALNHLQTSFEGGTANGSYYTELDCLWLLYCRNLVATTKLNAPYGIMARINGMALRMLTGEVPSERAIETILVEALSGWTELKCDHMFPR
ncbi:unnamed protein product [Diatraea saccharalis]|uniref:Uncharacterized protein n=1 Tax=Diatraea saccharalis TaxID=40085 RepID=A0A9N9WF64_9NEOP|nr:unnamed protein product [Diatraea saccharalis]